MRRPRARSTRVFIALLCAWTQLFVQATPAQSSGLLGQVFTPIKRVLDDVLGGNRKLVDVYADLDVSVSGVVDNVVGRLTDTVSDVLGPEDPSPPGSPGGDIPGVGVLRQLEVLDGPIEDVVHPTVVQPVAEGLAPAVQAAQPALAPIGPSVNTAVDTVYDSLAGVVSAAGLEEGAYEAVVTTPTAIFRRSGVVDVPTAMDINEDGLQDLELEVRVITTRPSIRVSRLPGAPGGLPVRVEAIIAPGGAGDPSRLAVGFDALGDTLPDVVRATLTDDGVQSGRIGVELHSVSPGSTLAVVGSSYTQGPLGPVDPSELSVSFTPPPTDVTATLAGALDGSGPAGLRLELSEPSRIEAAVRQTTGSTVEELAAIIDRAPNTLDLAVGPQGGGFDLSYAASAPVDRIALRQGVTSPDRTRSFELGVEGIQALQASLQFDPADAFNFQASDTIQALTLDAFDSAGLAGRANRLRVRIEGIPSNLSADLGDGSFGLDAHDGQIDLLEVQLTSGPDLFLDEGVDGLLLRDTADMYVVATRIRGLRQVSVAAPPEVGAVLVTTQGNPFTVDAIAGDTAITAAIDSLPNTVDVQATGSGLRWSADRVLHRLDATLQQGGRTASLGVTDLPANVEIGFGDDVVSWTADGVTPVVDLELADPAGVLGRATSVRAQILGLPTSLVAAITGGGFDLQASDPIGSIEVLATSGPEISLPDGAEGVVVRDAADDQVLTARVTGIRRLLVNDDPVRFVLSTDHARVFSLDVLTEAADGTSTALVATIDELPRDVSFTFSEDEDGNSRLAYTGSERVDLLSAQLVRNDPATSTSTATLAVESLPTELTLDLAEEGFSYTADSGFPSLELDVADPAGIAGRATRLAVRAADLPPAANFGVVDGRPELSIPDGEIGLLTALLTSGPEIAIDEAVDGLYVRDDPAQYVVALRITGLRGLSLDEGATAFTLRTAGGRIFLIDVLQATEDGESSTLGAELNTLPSVVSVGLGELTEGLQLDYSASSVMDTLRAQIVSSNPGEPDVTANIDLEGVPTEVTLGVDETGSVAYSASSRLQRLGLVLVDPAGVFGRATTLILSAFDLPTGISGSVDELGGLSLHTTGGGIGLAEALITDGPEIGVPDGTDGVVLRDTLAEFAIALRLTELEGLSFSTTDDGAALELATGAGRPLLVDGLIEAVDGDDTTSTAIEATLDSLPSYVGLSLAGNPTTGPGGEPATDRRVGYIASSSLGRLLASLALTDSEGTTTFALDAKNLPNDLTLNVRADGTVDYTASGGLGELRVTASDPAGIFAGATDLDARLVDLPNAVSIALGEDATITLDAHGGTLGLLEAKATSSPDVPVGIVDDVDGIVLLDRPGEFGTFIRVTNLRRVTVVPGPISIGLGTAGGRSFVVDAILRSGGVLAGDLSDVDIQAAMGPLPQDVSLGFDSGELQQLSLNANDRIQDVAFSLTQYPEGGGGDPLEAAVLIENAATQLNLGISINGTVEYAASQAVPQIAMDARDPDGLFDRADTLGLRLTTLPLALDLALSEDGAVIINAHGGMLGQMDTLITSGPDRRLAAGVDGIRYEDLADFIIHARFTNLSFGRVSQVPQPRVLMNTAGGRPLNLLLLESAPGKPGRRGTGVAYTEATLQNLPTSVDLELLEGAAGAININYQASQTANTLFFETNAGDKWVTQATISNPVPTSFRACQTDNAGCLPPPGINQTAANIGSFGVVASQHTTLNIWDCSRPLNTNCNPTNFGGAQIATHVNNFRIKTFHFGGDIQQGTVQASGRLYVNTVPPGLAFNQANSDTVQGGQIRNRDGSTRLDFTFGNGFRAWDRYRRFDRFPSLPFFGTRILESRGGIVCASGTNMSVTVNFIFDLTFNATSLLC